MNTVVVGGGWAGLAAAAALARQGVAVTLLEAAGQLGGRARRVAQHGLVLDNGQHLLVGAYRAALELLEMLGVPEHRAFERRPLELRVLSPSAPLQLRLPALPAPLHLLAGLARARGLGPGDKWRALRFCTRFQAACCDTGDEGLLGYLQRHGQSPALIARLWEPLCLAILNTPIEQASAALFTRVLHDVFGRRRGDSDLLFPRCDLGALVPDPARRFIEAHGGRIGLRQRVAALRIRDGRMAAVALTDGTELAADQAVLALPPTAAARLLAPLAATAAIAGRLGGLRSLPICTVYLHYPGTVRLPFPMVGLQGALTQWIFDGAPSGRPGLMAAVLSGPGKHESLSRQELQRQVASELAAVFPHWPPPQAAVVLREKQATFASTVGIDALRPGARTPLPGCWLAGDAVATGYPATLEGAVRSGLEAARGVMEEKGLRA